MTRVTHKEFREAMESAWNEYLAVRNPIVEKTQATIAAIKAEEDKELMPHLHRYHDFINSLVVTDGKIK